MPGLSKRNVLDALKKRHVYSTLDRNCRLSFTVNGVPMGDIIEEPVLVATLVVGVEDPDADDAVAKIEVVQKGKVRRAKLYYLRALSGRAARIKEKV